MYLIIIMDNKNHENIDENNEENNINENENGEDFEEDIYLMQLHKRFIEMKKDRKKAEQDANLLGNRLKLLKGEEEKTWKKIENTRKKTQEKVSNLQKLEEELRKKHEVIFVNYRSKKKRKLKYWLKKKLTIR